MSDKRERAKETRERYASLERRKWRERSSRRERVAIGPSQPGVRPKAIAQVTNATPTIISIMAYFLPGLGPGIWAETHSADQDGSDIFGNLLEPSYEKDGGIAADKPVTDVTRL